MLTIRQGQPADLSRVMTIYALARQRMREAGNPGQWGETYPPQALIEEDIAAGRCRVAVEDGVIRAVFALCTGREPTYEVIEQGAWPDDLPYVTLHRVATDGVRRGVFAEIAAWSRGQAERVRIDTHERNLPMRRVIERSGFTYCGVIHVEDGTPRRAYQWTAGGEEPAHE
nr:Histone acetyltransferase HPA2 and related acetyltransferases [uncultured bacterium]